MRVEGRVLPGIYQQPTYGALLCLLLLGSLLTGGCATKGKITNEAVVNLPAEQERYSFANYTARNPIGSVMLALTFSGRGTRAAALSYGVVEELRDTSFSKMVGMFVYLMRWIESAQFPKGALPQRIKVSTVREYLQISKTSFSTKLLRPA